MPSIPLKFGPGLSGAGSAGPRRVILIGVIAIGALGLVVLIWARSPQVEAPANIARAPKADALPGGSHTTPAYTDLATRHDKDLADKAVTAGKSSVASMPGSDTAIRIVVPPAPMVTSPDPPIRETGAKAALPTPTVAAPRPITYPAVIQPTVVQQTSKPDENQSKAYQAAISSLLAGWGGKPQATEVILRPEDEKASGGGEPGRIATASGGQAGETVATVQPVSNARRLGGRASGQVLMPAGRGVYARTVLAASSDQGGPVVIEALSGPIAGDRMTGSFERREERLVVRLNSITLQDGTQQGIEALVIAPDSMETSVASKVDQHYVSRFVLPVASAFVAGLGQAFAQSNQTVVAGPLGGATSFQRLNLPQQLGVGAGVAGAQLGAILKESAPKGPTVTLDANVNVGVVFLAPLIVGER